MNRRVEDGLTMVVGTVLALSAAALGMWLLLGAGLAHAEPQFNPHGTAPWSGPLGDQSPAAYWWDIAPEVHGDMDSARVLASTICATLRSGVAESHLIAEWPTTGRPWWAT